MNDDLVNRSAILELATYVICDEKARIEDEEVKLKKIMIQEKDKLLSYETLTDAQAQNLNYIEQVELAMKQDPSIGEITVLKTSHDNDEEYKSPMAAVCFKDEDTVFVQYQGTPKGGWVQDAVSFGTHLGEYMGEDGISSQIQEEGLKFFELCVLEYVQDGGAGGLVVGGHSQGGNVAEYVTMMSGYGALIDVCVALDAPNHSEELAAHVKNLLGDDYAKQAGKIVSINGANDFVNMLGQVSFAMEEYYINTNEGWAAEHGKGGAWGFHDMLYLMDREKGGLIPHKDQVDAMEQKELWKTLPLAEYAGHLAYVGTDEQIAFLGQFPPQQQAELFLLLPIGQQLKLLDELPKQQKEQIFAQITPKQQEEMKKKTEQWKADEEYKKQPQLSAVMTEEQKAKAKQKMEEEAQFETEMAKKAKIALAKVPAEIDEKRQDIFWGSLPMDKYVEILIYLLPPEDREAFLSLFPPKYQDMIMDHFTPEQKEEYRKQHAKWKNEQGPLAVEPTQHEIEMREWALGARDGAVQELWVAVQCWEVRNSQTGEQGELGKLMVELMAIINALPKDQLDSSTLTMMGILEMLLGSKELADLINVGLSVDDIIKLLAYGVPAILYTAENNIELTAESLKGLFPNYTDEIGGVLKILDMVPGSLVSDILKFAAVKSVKASEFLEAVAPILEMAAPAIAEHTKVEGLEKLFERNDSATKGKALGTGTIQIDENRPCLRVDTDKLRGYAAQMTGIINRLESKAEELRDIAAKEYAKPEEDRDTALIESCLLSANAMVSRVSDMHKVITYFLNVAETFERAEAKVLEIMGN